MLKLEVGKFYMSAIGEIVEIKRKKQDEFEDNNCVLYRENGQMCTSPSDYDLIAEIPKELHQHLIKEVMSYWQDEDFRNTVNSVYGGEK